MEQERGVRYFPIALFASVMGVSGVAISIRLIETILNQGHLFSNILVLLSSVMFIVNIVILLYRLIQFKDDVIEDFNHPVKMNFFGAIVISLLLLAVLYYDMNENVSFIVWALGAIFQVVLTLSILTKLIWEKSYQMTQFNPAWFIPIVGNIVVPLAGVHHVEPIINWIFFSIGIVFSIIYFTIFINRIFFYPALPVKLMPTFFILIAPPGIGFVSYVNLVGEVDIFAYILYGFAFYLGLLFMYQFKRFLSIPFFISWWSFLFPSAAVTNATIFLYAETGYGTLRILIIIQIIGLVLLMIYLLFKTFGLIRSGVLFVKEE